MLRRSGTLHTLISSGPYVGTGNRPTAIAVSRLFSRLETGSGSPPALLLIPFTISGGLHHQLSRLFKKQFKNKLFFSMTA
jgi:hypothetical protein